MCIEKTLFKDADCERLRKMMAEVADKRTSIRLQGVWLAGTGKRIHEVAILLGKSRQVIYKWVQVFLATHDPASLFESSRSGRPRSAGVITERRILTALRKDPLALGLGVGAWTVASLARYLNERHGTSITARTLRRRMKQIGLRYKPPRYVYEEKEPNRAQKKGLLSAN